MCIRDSFQGGRKGPFFYDVASFLWQAKAKFPETLRNALLEEYIDALCKDKPVDRDYFFNQLRHFVLFRTLQVLGAYGCLLYTSLIRMPSISALPEHKDDMLACALRWKELCLSLIHIYSYPHFSPQFACR